MPPPHDGQQSNFAVRALFDTVYILVDPWTIRYSGFPVLVGFALSFLVILLTGLLFFGFTRRSMVKRDGNDSPAISAARAPQERGRRRYRLTRDAIQDGVGTSDTLDGSHVLKRKRA